MTINQLPELQAKTTGTAVPATDNNADYKVPMKTLFTPTLLKDTGVLTYNTEASFACNWSAYGILIISLTFYSNVFATVVVSSAWFDTTTASTRVLISGNSSGNNVIVEVRKNDSGNIYCKLVTNSSYIHVTVYGL